MICLYLDTQKADEKYRNSAAKMANRYNTKNSVRTVSVGDKVSFKIPWIHRNSSNVPRVPCVVMEVLGQVQNLYCLRYVCKLMYTVPLIFNIVPTCIGVSMTY